MNELSQVPYWIRLSLWAAGVYNLLWGSVVVLFPKLLFRLGSVLDHPVETEIWQCLGMVIGVYGIGYLIAAHDPARHWPIVLVGFLGKLFGPLGFLIEFAEGSYWTQLWWMTVANDLIWWPPFLAALWYAARANQPGMTSLTPLGPNTLSEFANSKGETLLSLSKTTPVLVVFLRHAGCTFCREALSDLQRCRETIEGQGIQLALVHMGTEESGREFFKNYGLDDVPQFSDPNRLLYRHFDLKLGSFSQLFGLRVFWRGFFVALVRGHGVGRLQGNGFQMTGTFLLDNGKIVRGYRLRDASDRPDYCELSAPTA